MVSQILSSQPLRPPYSSGARYLHWTGPGRGGPTAGVSVRAIEEDRYTIVDAVTGNTMVGRAEEVQADCICMVYLCVPVCTWVCLCVHGCACVYLCVHGCACVYKGFACVYLCVPVCVIIEGGGASSSPALESNHHPGFIKV